MAIKFVQGLGVGGRTQKRDENDDRAVAKRLSESSRRGGQKEERTVQ